MSDEGEVDGEKLKSFPMKAGYYWAEVLLPGAEAFVEMPIFVPKPESYWFFISGLSTPMSYHSLRRWVTIDPGKL